MTRSKAQAASLQDVIGPVGLDLVGSVDQKNNGRRDVIGGLPGWRYVSFWLNGLDAHKVRQKREEFRARGLLPLLVSAEVPWFPGDPDKNRAALERIEAEWHAHGSPYRPGANVEIWAASPEVRAAHLRRRLDFKAKRSGLAQIERDRGTRGSGRRVHALNDENAALRARIAELESQRSG